MTPGAKENLVSSIALSPGIKKIPPDSTIEKAAPSVQHPSQVTQAEFSSRQNQRDPALLTPSEMPSPKVQSGTIAGSKATKEVTTALRAAQAKSISLREAMDKMIMSILMYSETKSDRRVYINGRKYVEGDLVDGLYLIESITLDGAVLSFEGERAVLRSGSK
jgi:hypothetical protein